MLTARDIRILRHVLRMRFLNREQIQRLEFGPRAIASCKRRLTLLYHNAYLDRVYVPVGVPHGSSRAVYCLDRRGASLLAFEDGLALAELDWRRQDNEKDLYFVNHTLDTNDVWVAALDSCHRHRWPLEWTDERALRRLLSGEKVTDPRDANTTITLIPDGYFRLEALGDQYAFALELDRGSVEEKRIRQKVRAYGQWQASGALRRHLRTDGLRVLFVISGRGSRSNRLERLKRWCEAEGGRSLFWFAEHEPVTSGDVLWDPLWQVAGRSGRHPLVEGIGEGPRVSPTRRLPALG